MSCRSVGERFETLLALAELKHESRNAVRVVNCYYTPVADWDEPWTLLVPDALQLTNAEVLNSVAWLLLLDDGMA